MIITIDGPAGTGKSTIAKKLAERLGFFYFDSGAMYRSFAWFASKKNLRDFSEEEIEKVLKIFHFEIKNEGEGHYFVNKEEVTQEIRLPEISKQASLLAAIPLVRKGLLPFQHQFAKHHNVVFEGRDMGSAVFPYADLKIY